METQAKQPLRTRTFVWTVDRNHGNKTGWLPVGAPANFYPGEGFLVAHDTLEHLDNKQGWDRELIAFGACMYGKQRASEEIFKGNISDFMNFLNQEGWKIPPTKAAWHKPLSPKEEHDLGIFFKGCKMYIEYRKDPIYMMISGNDPFRVPGNLEELFTEAKAWFRRGYRLAKRLHHNAGQDAVADLSYDIMTAVNNFTEKHQPHAGDRITIAVNRKNNTFKLQVGA